MTENQQNKDPAGVGPAFSAAKLLAARAKTIEIVEAAAAACRPGDSEDVGHSHLTRLFREAGIEKTWHPTKVRFGANTTKTFREVSDASVRLAANDVFYFDIGPIWDGHEGDFGRTFTLGDDLAYQRIAAAAEEVFAGAAAIWREERVSGRALYVRAAELAAKMGYELDARMDGHRVGDFPHALHWKRDLGDFEGVPAPGLWILEIHLREPGGRYGAFFEDLLVEE